MFNKLVGNLLLLLSLILIINYLVWEGSSMMSYYKLFECGFESFYWIHTKLSVHFFKIGIIFVLFDLELMFLLLSLLKIFIVFWLLLLFIFWTVFFEMVMMNLKWVLYLILQFTFLVYLD